MQRLLLSAGIKIILVACLRNGTAQFCPATSKTTVDDINTIGCIIPSGKVGLDQKCLRIDLIALIGRIGCAYINTNIDKTRCTGINIHSQGLDIPRCVFQQSLHLAIGSVGH